jgi:hypothetical protein
MIIQMERLRGIDNGKRSEQTATVEIEQYRLVKLPGQKRYEVLGVLAIR